MNSTLLPQFLLRARVEYDWRAATDVLCGPLVYDYDRNINSAIVTTVICTGEKLASN